MACVNWSVLPTACTDILDSFYIMNETEYEWEEQRLWYVPANVSTHSEINGSSNLNEVSGFVNFLKAKTIKKVNKNWIQTRIERLPPFVKNATNLCVNPILSLYTRIVLENNFDNSYLA